MRKSRNKTSRMLLGTSWRINVCIDGVADIRVRQFGDDGVVVGFVVE